MNLPDYSVLMSVYKNEKPDFLKTAMNSMWNQTVPPDDFVLMCDGPLTPELDTVIRNMEQAHAKLHVIRFPENHGLGHALQVGVKECKNEYVARMDSDDISRPERCEKELRVFENHPELAIVGSVIEEFTEIEPDSFVPNAVNSKRVVPETSEQIVEFAKECSVSYRKLSGCALHAGLLSLDTYADCRIQGLQHSGAACLYACGQQSVQEKIRQTVS